METQKTRPTYKAYCKVSRNSDKDEIFPNYFSFPPKVGDFVQAQSKKPYRIKSIIHTASFSKGKYGDTQLPRAILNLEKI